MVFDLFVFTDLFESINHLISYSSSSCCSEQEECHEFDAAGAALQAVPERVQGAERPDVEAEHHTPRPQPHVQQCAGNGQSHHGKTQIYRKIDR